MERRSAVFARLFEAMHEGAYIGTIGPESSSTIAANPHLKLIFGYASDVADEAVCPFARDRFVDPQPQQIGGHRAVGREPFEQRDARTATRSGSR